MLEDYQPRDVFFASPRRSLLGNGVAHGWDGGTPDELAECVPEVLADAEVPVALGAFPFGGNDSALAVPKTLRVGAPPAPGRQGGPARVPAPERVRSVPSRGAHAEAVSALVGRIADTPLRKAVLARMLELDFAEPVAAERIVANLLRENTSGYTFAVGLPDGATLLGASPELLLAKRGARVSSHPLAGSARRSADPVVDKENGEALAASAKNRDEHALVTEAVVEALRPFCRTLHVPPEPMLVATPTMWHLGTPITGELRDPGTTALRLAAALHPTPAVCGTPRALARQVLGELEPFDRGYYAGTVGWVDRNGDGEWAVSIRCGELAGTRMRLYAGGGIVAASDPLAEVDETSAKFQTLLRAMGSELTA
ncbi:isochorismate synthase [Prauserella sp. ASG 168]|uniref:isochorismate synthase n=1 Tax=Prauserella cavernicola TaxID=2800127 RepID=A0A934QMN2_9PSEU|nr:isochorismate synthase [Prauserella cavernicola]